MKRIIALFILVSVIMSLVCPIALAKTFSDVSKTHWSYVYVNELSDKGIINGYEDETFKPDGNVTKAEFIKLLMCAESDNTFDTSSYANWYEPYFNYASENGYLMSSVDATTANEYITRREMAHILGIVCLVKNIIPPQKEYTKEELSKIAEEYFETHEKVVGELVSIPPEKFDDTKGLYQEDVYYIEALADVELIKGYEDNTFRPNNNITRAETATVISRFLDMKSKKSDDSQKSSNNQKDSKTKNSKTKK